MNSSGDAAEQVVRLSLEGLEVEPKYPARRQRVLPYF